MDRSPMLSFRAHAVRTSPARTCVCARVSRLCALSLVRPKLASGHGAHLGVFPKRPRQPLSVSLPSDGEGSLEDSDHMDSIDHTVFFVLPWFV